MLFQILHTSNYKKITTAFLKGKTQLQYFQNKSFRKV